MKNYQITILTPQDLNHSSYAQAGCFELDAKGEIRCKIKFNTKRKLGRVSTENECLEISNHPQPKTSFYELENIISGEKIFFALDLYDISHFFSEHALENCDYIFKRNYISKHVEVLKSKYSTKIIPAGLTFGCQSQNRKKWLLFKLAYFISIFKLRVKFDRSLIKRIKSTISHYKKHIKYVSNGRSLNSFREFKPSKYNRVFYQVRCFPRIEDEDVKEIHKQRSELIRTLKNKLKDKYFGGLVPNEFAKKNYSDCITNLPTDSVSYLELIKDSSICIYTKGLQNSPARKLSEYLSQGKCIVAERFETELPVPLEHNKHLMYYNTVEECVAICKYLLSNPEKVTELSHNARMYYEKHIDPEKNLQRIIKFIINDKNL